MLCDEKYRSADAPGAATTPTDLVALYGDLINTAMSDIPSDMTYHHASVPRQL